MKFGIGKLLTSIASGVALLGATAAIVVFTLNDIGAASISQETYREYKCEFYDYDGSFLDEQIIKRGDYVVFPTVDMTIVEDLNVINQFYGWDLTGDGILDVPAIPTATGSGETTSMGITTPVYFNFKAKPVYLRLDFNEFEPDPKAIEEGLNLLANALENLNVELTEEQIETIVNYLINMNLDISNIDVNLLERILNILGMDLLELLEKLNLSFEDALNLLNAPVFTYSASDNSLPHFFRTRSYGNYKKNKWTNADAYMAKNISEESVNPLQYSFDKLSNIVSTSSYEIDYHKSGKYYPTPAYEARNNQGLNSDSHGLENPETNPTEDFPKQTHYSTHGIGFYPASSYSIIMTKLASFSSKAISQDEKEYRNYVREKYLTVDEKYKEYLLDFANKKEIEINNETYGHVSQINEIFKDYKMKDFTEDMLKAYPDGVDQITYFLEHPEEGGTSGNFASATTLLYRSLGIPARYVEGYFDINLEGTPTRTVGGLQAHSWVEIYIDDLGWMMVDTSISSLLPEEMASLLFGKPDIDLNNELGELEKIEIDIKDKTYFTNAEIDVYKVNINAVYSNGVTTKVDFHKPESYKNNDEEDDNGGNSSRGTGAMQNFYEVNEKNPKQAITIAIGATYQIGQIPIKVIFKDRDNTAVATTYVEIIEPSIVSLEVDLNSYQQYYMPGNDLNISTLEVVGIYNDPSKPTERMNINSELITCEPYDNGEISTAEEGVYTYIIYLTENPDVFTTFDINVSYTPTKEMVLYEIQDIANSEENPYRTLVDSFDLTEVKLGLTYIYTRRQDNFINNSFFTYKEVDGNDTNMSYSGDLSSPGVTYITVSYTHNGTTKNVQIKVRVRGTDSDLLIDVHNYKEYDGISFADTEFITIHAIDNKEEKLFEPDEHIEYRIVDSDIDFKDFYDCKTYAGAIQFRLINDKGEILNDTFFEGSTLTDLTYYDYNHKEKHITMHYHEGFFEPNEEGWIDLDIFHFTIDHKPITIETFDAVYYSGGYYQFDKYGNDSYYSTYDRVETVKISNIVLAAGDEADWYAVSFDNLKSDQQSITNRFNPDTFHIYSNTRFDAYGNRIEVTSNYTITYKWGTITRG